ncbi:unnamed protein product [Brachionus calyciflorus]|uniref:RING-type domain-containing protein n=1 Tax=Brachionus calyciflorus TaxID=104777 RepID=A0A814I399_9BILA|nr:unnamed protein product [Brachionus calyciflorus]
MRVKCPKCNKNIDLPRVLPCGETICSKCITSSGLFECFFCKFNHQVPKEGFPLNKILLKSFDLFKNCLEKNCNDYNELVDGLNDLEKKFENFKNAHEKSEMDVIEKCQGLINEIDLTSEQKIKEINTIRFELIDKVNEYKKSCLSSLKSYEPLFNNLKSDVNNLLTSSKDILIQKEKLSEDLKSLQNLNSKVTLSSNLLERIKFDFKSFKIIFNRIKLSQDFLGPIIVRDLRVLKFEQSNKFQNSEKFKHFSSQPSQIQIGRLCNQRLAFGYVYKSNFNMEKISIHVINSLDLSCKTIDINQKCTDNFLMSTYKDSLYYYNNSYLNKYSSELNLIKSIEVYGDKKWLVATEKLVFLYTNCGKLNIHDTDLNLMTTTVGNCQYFWINLPIFITNMWENEKFYIFRNNSSLTLLNKTNGVKYGEIKLKINDDVIKVTKENWIIIFDNEKFKISYLSLNGEILDELSLDGFQKGQKCRLLMDESDNFELFDFNENTWYTKTAAIKIV